MEFDLEPGTSAGCLWDYIDIFTIDAGQLKNLEDRVCGNAQLPAPFSSIHQRVELTFKSDYTTARKGFLAKYHFLNESWQPFPTSSPGCSTEFLTDEGGEITSPQYPLVSPPDSQCTWMIRTKNNRRIMLNFREVNLGHSPDACTSSSYVAVYNGFASPSSRPDKIVCRLAAKDKISLAEEFISKSFRVVIRYQAGHGKELARMSAVNEAYGFRITWTAFWIPTEGNKEEKCEEFHCKGGEYCIDTSRLLCNPLPRYCIDKRLRCNQAPNCGSHDHSDEDGCFTAVQLSVGFSVTLLILLITGSVLGVFCRHRARRLNKDRMLTLERIVTALGHKKTKQQLGYDIGMTRDATNGEARNKTSRNIASRHGSPRRKFHLNQSLDSNRMTASDDNWRHVDNCASKIFESQDGVTGRQRHYDDEPIMRLDRSPSFKRRACVVSLGRSTPSRGSATPTTRLLEEHNDIRFGYYGGQVAAPVAVREVNVGAQQGLRASDSSAFSPTQRRSPYGSPRAEELNHTAPYISPLRLLQNNNCGCPPASDDAPLHTDCSSKSADAQSLTVQSPQPTTTNRPRMMTSSQLLSSATISRSPKAGHHNHQPSMEHYTTPYFFRASPMGFSHPSSAAAAAAAAEVGEALELDLVQTRLPAYHCSAQRRPASAARPCNPAGESLPNTDRRATPRENSYDFRHNSLGTEDMPISPNVYRRDSGPAFLSPSSDFSQSSSTAFFHQGRHPMAPHRVVGLYSEQSGQPTCHSVDTSRYSDVGRPVAGGTRDTTRPSVSSLV